MALKLELNRVHILEKIQGSMQFRLTRTQPAMRLARKDEVVFLQRGVFFDQGGHPIEKNALPGWLPDELKMCNPAVLKECGYTPTVKGA